MGAELIIGTAAFQKIADRCRRMLIIRHVLHPDPSSSTATSLPAWITPAWVQRVRTTFQPYYSTPLTDQDAVENLLSMGNLFRLLKGDKEVSHDTGNSQSESTPEAFRRAG
jgi:hypothetical protein